MQRDHVLDDVEVFAAAFRDVVEQMDDPAALRRLLVDGDQQRARSWWRTMGCGSSSSAR
ncbi:MAG: hypothetical protein R2856_26260 [Caldilineaceae bacterium]